MEQNASDESQISTVCWILILVYPFDLDHIQLEIAFSWKLTFDRILTFHVFLRCVVALFGLGESLSLAW